VISFDFSSVASPSQHQPVFCGPRTHQMQRLLAYFLIMRAPARFPINCDDPFDGGADPLHPLEKTRLKLFGINQGKNSSKGIMGGYPVGQLQQIGEPGFLRFPKFFDPYPSVRSTNRYDDDISPSMLLGSFDTWVLDLSKNRFKG
jgi:hypothetical protein